MKLIPLFLFIVGFALSPSIQAQFIETGARAEFQARADSQPEMPSELGMLGTERTELEDETLVLRGQITVFEFAQPESRIVLDANFQSWELIAPSAVELRRLGWTSKSLFTGEMIEVEAVRLLGAENKASLKSLTRANGALLITSVDRTNNQPQSFRYIPGGMYGLDTDHAHLQFAYDHMGFSKSSIKVERLSADVLWNSESPESSIIQLDIDVSSLRSGVPNLDEALRGPEFFDFLNSPKIQFKSTRLNFSKWGDLEVNGQLEILGLNRPVQLKAQLNKVGLNPLTQQTTVGISLSGEVSRSDWGLNAYLPTINDRIEISFEGEFILQSPETALGF